MDSRFARLAQNTSRTRRDTHLRRHRQKPRTIEALERRDMMAADPIVFDSNSATWYAYWNQTSTQWSDIFAKRKADSIPVDIEITDDAGVARVGGIWQKNTDGRDWVALRNMSSDSFGTKWDEYRSQGYRLIDQESYTLSGTRYYAGIWIKNVENLAWVSRRNMTASSRQSFIDQYKGSYMPVDVDSYDVSGSMRYSVIMVRNLNSVGWEMRTGLTSTQFGDLYDARKNTHRVLDIESYTEGGQQKYQVVWIQNSNGRGWASRRDLSYTQFWNEFNSYNDRGYRLVDYERYKSGSNWRYAAVWRQNSERINWSHRSGVDKIIADHMDDFDVPGIGVTVFQNGSVKYRRGFGHQDIGDGLQYSSNTINRLASVSKAVGGVLALDLDEQGLLDIDRKTNSYTGKVNNKSIPSQHTHTLRQLLSHRAGVRHYDSKLDDFSGTYSTALAASAEFWSDKLVAKPGVKYSYSTHGYTLLGAAMEGALGKSITQIVKERLTDRYSLGTLKVENRSVSNQYRASLYDENNKEVSADNLSWKILGGGLESSVYDLARFGNLVIDGTILTSASRSAMHADISPSTGESSEYGLGWRHDTRNGTKWVGHSGEQTGASTYLLLYPQKGISIAVTINGRDGGYSPTKIANKIGDLLLGGSSSSSSASRAAGSIPASAAAVPMDVAVGKSSTNGAATSTKLSDSPSSFGSSELAGTLQVSQLFDLPSRRGDATAFGEDKVENDAADALAELTDAAFSSFDDWTAPLLA